MHDPESEYPPEAYADDGTLWWELETWPDKRLRFGAEPRIAAWLAFNRERGETFNMRSLREALGSDAIPNDDEHLNRRLRSLRDNGWQLPTNNDDKSIPVGEYRVDTKGWHPAQGPRPRPEAISAKMTRFIFKRDGQRCVLCGVGNGEPYPGEPDTHAVITAGHRRARANEGSAKDPDNLETQCKRCNEPVREEIAPESVDDVLRDLRMLRTHAELEKLETWLSQGYRSRDRLDLMHDRVRALSPRERKAVLAEVRKRLGR